MRNLSQYPITDSERVRALDWAIAKRTEGDVKFGDLYPKIFNDLKRQIQDGRLTHRELGAVLAGLRLLQVHAVDGYPDGDVLNIATDTSSFEQLSPEELDELCDRFNGGDLA